MQNDYYEVSVPPAEPLVALDEARLWIRRDDVDVTIDDVLIQELVSAATGLCEKYTNRCFVERTIAGHFASLVESNRQNYPLPFVQVRRSPIIAISSVSLFVDGDYSVVVDPADYEIEKTSGFGRLRFREIPNADDVPYPIQVVFTAGYGAAADVPESIKTAVKQYVAFLYENRGDVAPDGKQGMPLEIRAILTKYRILNTF